MNNPAEQHCAPCEGDTQPMTEAAANQRLGQLTDHWALQGESAISGDFEFKNYYQTQAFVNAVAWIAHCEDHHPDITFGYKNCHIELTTHAIGGLSDNDFIVAAKVDRLLA